MSEKGVIMAKNLKLINENPILKEINCDKDIIVLGSIGVGKTMMIEDAKKSSDVMLIYGTVASYEYIFLRDADVFNLYHTCLIIKKIIKEVNDYCRGDSSISMSLLSRYIDNILEQIKIISMTSSDYKYNLINNDLLKNPIVLINRVIELIELLNIPKFRIIIDDFDKVGGSSERYQKFVLNFIKPYFSLIYTISSENVLNSKEYLEKLSQENILVYVNTGKELNSVKNILDVEVRTILKKHMPYNFSHSLSFVLSDETILEMINKTSGNLFQMIQSIHALYDNIDSLNQEEYESFILNYIDIMISKTPSFVVVPTLKRTLYTQK